MIDYFQRVQEINPFFFCQLRLGNAIGVMLMGECFV